MNIYWSNLLAWCIQVAMIVAASARHCLGCSVFAPPVPGSGIGTSFCSVCLALPFLQPWAETSAQHGPTSPSPPDSSVSPNPASRTHLASRGPWWRSPCCPPESRSACSGSASDCCVCDAIAPRPSLSNCADDSFADLRLALAPEAEILISGNVTSPVTFGRLKRLSSCCRTASRDLGLHKSARSIVCHELIHIRRHDWAVAIAEELVRSILWFHPAIWWLLGQIQLTREQVVDQEVIRYTGDRNRYLDALLAIASLRLTADLAPAPLFLKKHHLRQRVESIVSGVTMTKRNLLLPLAAAFATLPVVIGIAAWQFPLRAAPQEAVDDPGIEMQLGAAKILHRTGIPYPEEARAKQFPEQCGEFDAG